MRRGFLEIGPDELEFIEYLKWLAEERQREKGHVKKQNHAIAIDADPMNADWSKQTWDVSLPQSLEEMREWLHKRGMTAEEFRRLPLYKYNVDKIPWLRDLSDEEPSPETSSRQTRGKARVRKGRQRPESADLGLSQLTTEELCDLVERLAAAVKRGKAALRALRRKR